MNSSEKFRKFAAECQAMAKLARSAESKATWGRLAGRWVQCAEFVEHAEHHASAATRDRLSKQHRSLGRSYSRATAA
jgi:hypothetical protein